MNINELHANHFVVSVHKYGFFLCRRGTARIMLGTGTYCIARHHLCIYAPNTFFQILERSADLEGILEEDDVETYYPVLSSIDIRRRLQVRTSPCVVISDAQADEMVRLYGLIREYAASSLPVADQPDARRGIARQIRADSLLHLRYALCLKVLEAYFSHTPVEAMPQTREDALLNRFLVSLHDNCHRQRSVQYYADEQHLSPCYFSSLIRERSGQTAMQWIAHVTMTFARQYLTCTDMSVKEVTDRLNFPDQSTFGRFFKHHEGCSPLEYRARKALATNDEPKKNK